MIEIIGTILEALFIFIRWKYDPAFRVAEKHEDARRELDEALAKKNPIKISAFISARVRRLRPSGDSSEGKRRAFFGASIPAPRKQIPKRDILPGDQ